MIILDTGHFHGISWKTSWGYHKSEWWFIPFRVVHTEPGNPLPSSPEKVAPINRGGQGWTKRLTSRGAWTRKCPNNRTCTMMGLQGSHPDHFFMNKKRSSVPHNTLNKQKVMKLQFAVFWLLISNHWLARLKAAGGHKSRYSLLGCTCLHARGAHVCLSHIWFRLPLSHAVSALALFDFWKMDFSGLSPAHNCLI